MPKSEDFHKVVYDLVEGQYYGNNNSYSYSAGFLSSVLIDMYHNLPKSHQSVWKARLQKDRKEAWSKIVNSTVQ